MLCSGMRNSMWSVSPWFSLRKSRYLRMQKRASKFQSGNVRIVQHYGAFVQHLLQWKSINVTYSDCVFVASFNQHVIRVRHIVFCVLSGSTIFFHFISLTARLTKKVIEYKMCVLIFSTILSKTFLILRRTERDRFKNVYQYSSKVTVIFVRV